MSRIGPGWHPGGGYTADDVRRHAERTGLGAPPDRHAAIAATVTHIVSVIGVFRSLDVGDTPPSRSPLCPPALTGQACRSGSSSSAGTSRNPLFFTWPVPSEANG